jgi:uroporphyrin-3 C-methyltransferase
MTDPLPPAPVPAQVSRPVSPPTPRAGRISPGLVGAWVIALVALLAAGLLWQRVSDMQRQLARQSTDAGNWSVQARTLAQQAANVSRDNAVQLATLQSRVNDLSAYRAQLDQLAQNMSRASDENLATELETTLRMAQDQVQLTGSSQPLLAALGLAQRRLAKAADPRLAPVASAVARDMVRVKAASIPDTAGLLARIDQLLRQVDDLPAANGVGLVREKRNERDEAAVDARLKLVSKTNRKKAPAPSDWERARQWLSQAVWQPIAQQAVTLVRVRRVDEPDAMMMAPDQVFFVRENLKLRLEGARLAILTRQYEPARADLAAANTALGTWFDPAARRTQSAATLLQQIRGETRSADLPHIDATLLALGNVQAAIDAAGK